MKVELTEQEWQLVLNILGDAPWKIANPLLMKIAGQLRSQDRPDVVNKLPEPTAKGDGADKEVRHEQ